MTRKAFSVITWLAFVIPHAGGAFAAAPRYEGKTILSKLKEIRYQ
jgi:hypothetical protein